MILVFSAACHKDLETPERDNPFDPAYDNTDVFNLTAESRNDGVFLSWNQITAVDIDGYRIYRSTDSSQAYVRLADSLSAGTYFDYDLTGSQAYYYKVTAFRDTDETSLDICPYAGPIGLSEWLIVDDPDSGTSWTVGDTVSLAWRSYGTSGSISVEFTGDGGLHWSVLAVNIQDTGEYEFVVDAQASTNCRIRVMDTDGSPTGSSAVFTIIDAPGIAIISPAMGAAWLIGSIQQIRWNSVGETSGQVTISLSRNGTEWENLFTEITDDGSESWQVSDSASSNCFIKIQDPYGIAADISDTFAIVDSSQSYISIVIPSASDEWTIGEEYQITWYSNATSELVDIDISRNLGYSWESIEAGVADDGTERWIATGPASSICIVRIADIDGNPTGFSGIFSLSSPPEPVLSITSPQAGDDWEIDSIHEIDWTSSGTSGTVSILLSRDDGDTWETIEGFTDDTDGGTYEWTVTGPPSTQCRVSIVDIDDEPADSSDLFTISETVQETLQITAPQPSDEWEIGTEKDFRWYSANTSGSVMVQLSRNAGRTWVSVASNEIDDGIHPWTVQGPASDSCMVRINDSDGDPTDISGIFSIIESSAPFISIFAPWPEAEWGIDTHRWIEWESEGTSGLLSISLSRNGGTDWESIVGETVDDGVYEWDVTGPVSNTCIFRIQDSDDSPVTDSETFRIIDMSPIIMVSVPGGSFQMGFYDSLNPSSDQNPVHSVSVGSFLISKYEITQSQYADYDSDHESYYDGWDLNPVEGVSWYDAAMFCNWLSDENGYGTFYDDDDLLVEAGTVHMNWEADGYRLPTEAEWEYACRAGTQTHYYIGDTDALYNYCEPLDLLLNEIAWYCGNTQFPIGVGAMEPNSFVLYDMSGNVFEWCNDWYADDYYEYAPAEDPRGPETGLQRVIRGGSWYDNAIYCRSATRRKSIPGDTYPDIGFRVLRPIDQPLTTRLH